MNNKKLEAAFMQTTTQYARYENVPAKPYVLTDTPAVILFDKEVGVSDEVVKRVNGMVDAAEEKYYASLRL